MRKRDAVFVFSFYSTDTVLHRHGGSQSWRLDPKNASQCKYVVMTRNARDKRLDRGAIEPHGSAFLVGLLTGVVPAPDRPERWLLKFSHYALVDIPTAWPGEKGYQNPVRYGRLQDIGIDPQSINWLPMPEIEAPAPAASGSDFRAVIEQHKAALATSLGISPDMVEINIKS